MADEKLRVMTFDTVELDDNDWEGPHRDEDTLTYKSRTPAASLKITRGGSVIFDQDFGKGKTITIVAHVIHIPEGAQKEI
jgi:predicted kinase